MGPIVVSRQRSRYCRNDQGSSRISSRKGTFHTATTIIAPTGKMHGHGDLSDLLMESDIVAMSLEFREDDYTTVLSGPTTIVLETMQ